MLTFYGNSSKGIGNGIWRCACSPYVCVGYLQMLWFPLSLKDMPSWGNRESLVGNL